MHSLESVGSAEWHQKLEKYRETRPGLRVIDKLQSVMQLSNRVKMLKPMETDIVLTVGPPKVEVLVKHLGNGWKGPWHSGWL